MRWILLLVLAVPLHAAFSHCRPITNTVQPSSSLTDFPTLWADTLAFMKTTGNGGELTSASGYDVIIYPSTGCTGTPLAYSRESWNGTTGEFKIWIKHATLSTSATTLYVGTGDSGVTTDQSDSSATFSVSGLISRYPFTDGTTLSVADTKGAHNGTATSMSAAAGKIDGGASWGTPGTSKIVIASARVIADLANSTVSMWMKTPCVATSETLYVERTPAQNIWKLHNICSSGKVAFVHRTDASVLDLEVAQTSVSVDDDAWHHVAITKTGTAIVIYVDGVSRGTATLTGNDTLTEGTTESAIGLDAQDTANDRFSGLMDEVRIHNVAKSAAWVAHEYENSNNASYWTVGADQFGSTTRRRVIITQ